MKRRFWIMLIYFFSGLCSLIYEVVWVRLLKLTLGNTVYASSIVVSTFMAGLALGALIMRRRTGNVKRPLLLYAALELGVTVSAVLLPVALHAADAAYRWLYITCAPSPFALLVTQVALSSALMLVPSMLMGSTLPLLGNYVTRVEQRIGRRVGKLYALNMLGAALGCFSAGLILIRLVGVMGTLLIAVAINLLVAASAYFLFRSCNTVLSHEAMPAATVQTPGMRTVSRLHSIPLLVCVFVSGFASIGYELVWMRSFILKLGGWTYVFSSVLTVYLVGNVIGAGIGSRLTARLKNPAAALGVSLMCLGASGVLFAPHLSWWLGLETGRLFGKALESSAVQAVGWPLFHAAALFLLPSIAMGVGFPLALQAWQTREQGVGSTTGQVYGINMIGAVFGGILTGFVLIPILGVQGAAMLLGLLAAWAGAVVLQAFLARPRPVLRTVGVLAIAGLTVLASTVPPGMVLRSAATVIGYTTLEVREDTTTTAAVMRHENTWMRVLASDNVLVAGEDEHRIAQQMLGHLGPLLHPNPKSVLSIGFGSGETTACIAEYDPDRLDCVEIAPELVQLALKHFSDINLGDDLHAHVNMIYRDGKNYLRMTDAGYDVIINGANVPTDAASAPMFTRDHFLNAKRRLNPGGLFVTKLHLADISRSHFDSILGTFLEAFPHATLWFPATNPTIFFYLVGSSESQVYAPTMIDRRLSSGMERLDRLRFASSLDVLSCYIGDEKDISRYLGAYRTNTDDSPFIEFSLDRTRLDRASFVAEFLETVRTNSLGRHLDWTGAEVAYRNLWQSTFAKHFRAVTYVMQNYSSPGTWKRLENCSEGLKLVPGHPALVDQETRTLKSVTVALLSDSTGDRARAALAGVREHPGLGTSWLIRAWALRGMGRSGEALESVREALARSPGSAMAHATLGTMLFEQGKPGAGHEAYEEAVRISPTEATFRFSLAAARRSRGDLAGAVVELRQGLTYRPGATAERIQLADILLSRGNTAAAEEEYRVVLEIDPQNREAEAALARISP